MNDFALAHQQNFVYNLYHHGLRLHGYRSDKHPFRIFNADVSRLFGSGAQARIPHLYDMSQIASYSLLQGLRQTLGTLSYGVDSSTSVDLTLSHLFEIIRSVDVHVYIAQLVNSQCQFRMLFESEKLSREHLLHAMVTSCALNQLRKQQPHFVGFYTPIQAQLCGEEYVHLVTHHNNYWGYLEEYFPTTSPLNTQVQQLSLVDLHSLLFMLIRALLIAYQEHSFVHGNLQARYILVHSTRHPIVTHYQDAQIRVRNVVLNDFKQISLTQDLFNLCSELQQLDVARWKHYHWIQQRVNSPRELLQDYESSFQVSLPEYCFLEQISLQPLWKFETAIAHSHLYSSRWLSIYQKGCNLDRYILGRRYQELGQRLKDVKLSEIGMLLLESTLT